MIDVTFNFYDSTITLSTNNSKNWLPYYLLLIEFISLNWLDNDDPNDYHTTNSLNIIFNNTTYNDIFNSNLIDNIIDHTDNNISPNLSIIIHKSHQEMAILFHHDITYI